MYEKKNGVFKIYKISFYYSTKFRNQHNRKKAGVIIDRFVELNQFIL